ncbi:MAG TPA: hypothetical protein VM842_03325 [Nitrospira sp.]|nr:hypothetical protein [Nitrospira sp.]
MMLVAVILVIAIFLFAVSMPMSLDAADTTATNKKVGSDQGLTLENIGRGIKSAAKNIEEEIPKIGPAIGDTIKKATRSDTDKTHPKPSARQSGTSPK